MIKPTATKEQLEAILGLCRYVYRTIKLNPIFGEVVVRLVIKQATISVIEQQSEDAFVEYMKEGVEIIDGTNT